MWVGVSHPMAVSLLTGCEPDDEGCIDNEEELRVIATTVAVGEEPMTPAQVEDFVKQHRIKDVVNKTKFRRHICALVRNKTGLPKPTAANRLMVDKVTREFLIGWGLRPTHVNAHAPVIVMMVFTPNDADLEARALACDVETQRRFNALSGLDWKQRLLGVKPIEFRE